MKLGTKADEPIGKVVTDGNGRKPTRTPRFFSLNLLGRNVEPSNSGKERQIGAGGTTPNNQQQHNAERSTPWLMSAFEAAGNWAFLHVNFLKQWVVGAAAEDAIKQAQKLNEKGSSAIICCLGEHIKEKAVVDEMMQEYRRLLPMLGSEIRAGRIHTETSIAIRPSPFGSDVVDSTVVDARAYSKTNMEELVKLAKENGVLVWMDMEGSHFTDYTLEVYKELQAKYGNVGIALQANLVRTADDMRSLMTAPELTQNRAYVRLVKGIYKETVNAYEAWNENHKNFSDLIGIAFKESDAGFKVAVGTHHAGHMLEALELSKDYPKEKFEIQTLMGVRDDLTDLLRSNGYAVTVYVPYGKKAFAYSVRRMMRSPEKMSTMLPMVVSIFKAAYKILYGSEPVGVPTDMDSSELKSKERELRTYLNGTAQ